MTGIHPFHVLPVAVIADEICEPLPVDDFIWIDGSRPAVNHSDDENLPKQSVFQLGYCLKLLLEEVNVHIQVAILHHVCLPMVLYASDSMTMSGWSSERPTAHLRERYAGLPTGARPSQLQDPSQCRRRGASCSRVLA